MDKVIEEINERIDVVKSLQDAAKTTIETERHLNYKLGLMTALSIIKGGKKETSVLSGVIIESETRKNASEEGTPFINTMPMIRIDKKERMTDISNPCRECGDEVEDPENFSQCMMCYNIEMSG